MVVLILKLMDKVNQSQMIEIKMKSKIQFLKEKTLVLKEPQALILFNRKVQLLTMKFIINIKEITNLNHIQYN